MGSVVVSADEIGYLSSTFTIRVRAGTAICSPASLTLWPVADTPGSWLAGRRMVAIDGTCLDVADTPENADYFGRPAVESR